MKKPTTRKGIIRMAVWNKYNRRCAYCGCDITIDDMVIDHIVPLIRSKSNIRSDPREKGVDDVRNYNPSCRACNIRKGADTLETFRYNIENTIDNEMRNNANFRQMVRFKQVAITPFPVVFFFERFEKIVGRREITTEQIENEYNYIKQCCNQL